MQPIGISSFPYLIHTNRELGMMLRGEKPLANFCDVRDRFPEVVTRYLRLFDRHVASGRFIRHDHLSTASESSQQVLHRILFALPGEEWRIQAMVELHEKQNWTQALERREGELLGYTDWQNDFYMANYGVRFPTS